MSLSDLTPEHDGLIVGYSPHIQNWLTDLMRGVVGSSSNLKFRWITSPMELEAIVNDFQNILLVFHSDHPLTISALGDVEVDQGSLSHLRALVPQHQGLQVKSLYRAKTHQSDSDELRPSLGPAIVVPGSQVAPSGSGACEAPQSQPSSQGVVIATMGTPNSGATELAIALSARLGKASSTALLDTTFDGALPFRMGFVRAQPTISELARSYLQSESPDRSADSYCQRLPQWDFDVLLGVANPRHSALIDYQVGTAILRDLQRRYRFVVADISSELLLTPFGDIEDVRERLSLCALAQERSSYIILTTRADALSLLGFATALESWGKLALKATSFTVAILDAPNASGARRALREELSAILTLCHEGVGQLDELIEIPKDTTVSNRLDPSAIPQRLIDRLHCLKPTTPATFQEPVGRLVSTKSHSLGELYDYFDALPYS